MKTLRYVLILLFTLLGAGHFVHAQNTIQTTLMVNAPYSNQLSEYITSFDQRVTLVLMGNADVRITGTLKSNTGVSITLPEPLSYYKSKGIGINPVTIRGQKRISGADIGNMFTSDPTRNTSSITLQRGVFGSSFVLPEGDYEVCLKVFDGNSDKQLADEVCRSFTIQNIEPPYLLSPVDKDTMTTATATYQPVQFQWTFPAGAQPNRIEYVLQIAELRAGQNPYNVFESGPPFAEIVVPNANPVYFLKANDPRFEVGRQYAWRVRVRGKGQYEGLTNFQNNGLSTVNTFVYGAVKTTVADNLVTSSEKVVGTATAPSQPTAVKGVSAYNVVDGPSQCSCKFDKPADTSIKSELTVGESIMIGGDKGYQLTISEVSSGSNGGSDGKGTIALSPALLPTTRSSGLFIPLKVEFKGLVCNRAGVMMDGTVTSQKRAGSVIDYMPSTSDNTSTLNLTSLMQAANGWNWVRTNITDVASAQFNGAGVETPLGIQNVGGLVTIALDNFLFTATSAQYDALTVFEEKNSATPVLIPLGVKGACMPNFSNCGNTTLYLVNDTPLGGTGLSLVGGTDVANATHATFALSGADAGLKNLHIMAAYEIPGAKAITTDGTAGGPVKAMLTADTKDGFGNWMAKASVNTKFKMDGVDEFEFELAEATYDHDASRNPAELPAMLTELAKSVNPAELKSLETTDWMGFYMPRLSVTLPSVFQTETGRTTVSMTNVIIDNQHGLTGSLGIGTPAQPVIEFNKGSLDGWYFSLDNIGVTFFDKSFVNAKASGLVGLPISGPPPADNTRPSGLTYTTTLSPDKATGKLRYSFSVVPTGNLNASVWGATMTVNADSRIDITLNDPTVNSGKLLVKAKLNGGLAFAPTKTFSLDLLKINNLVIQSVSPYVVVDAATSDSFKQAAGDTKSFFSGSFTETKQAADITKKSSGSSSKSAGSGSSGTGAQASAAGFPLVIEEFRPIVDAGSGGIIRAGFYFYGGLRLTDIALAPKAFVGLRVLASVQFNGKRPVWKGVEPEIDKVAVAGQIGPVKIKGGLDLYRGNEVFGTGFRGYLTAEMTGGIGVNVNAQFGNKGYNYWYVHAGVSGLHIPVGPVIQITGFMGGAYHNMTLNTPVSVGAMANLPQKTLAATATDAPLFTPSPTGDGIRAGVRVAIIEQNVLKAQAIATVQWNEDGLQLANLKGEAQLINPDGDTDTKGMINGTADLTYDFRENVFHATADMTADQTLFTLKSTMDVLMDRDKYHLFVGTPNDRNKLTVAGVFDVQSYFMVGNDIPDIPEPVGIPHDVLYGKLHYKPARIGGYGTGIGFGASLYLHYEKSILGITPHVTLAAGLDVSIRKAATPTPCAGGRIPGYKGWYAQGNVYAYINGGVDFWGLTSIDVSAGGLLQVGLPNPTWVNGTVFVSISTALKDFDADIHVELGDQCQLPASSQDFAFTKPLIKNIDLVNDERDVSLFKQPVITLNYPTTFEVAEALPDKDGNQPISSYTIQLKAECMGGGSTTVFKSNGDAVRGEEKRMDRIDERTWQTWTTSGLSMAANTDYTLKVTAEVSRQVSKISNNKTIISAGAPLSTELVTLHFRTQPKLMQLDEIVQLQYPYAGQKYALAGELKTGQINLSRVINFADYNDSRFTYDPAPWFLLTDEKTGTTLQAKAKQTSAGFSYPIPRLATNTTYTCRFVLKGKGKPITFSYVPVNSNNKPTTSSAVTNTASGKVAAAPVATDLVDVDLTLYSYRFRTSQYNTFDEKMAALKGTMGTQPVSAYATFIKFDGAESFDNADLVPAKYQNGLVSLAAEPGLSSFFQKKAKAYDRLLTDGSSNNYWAADPLFQNPFASQFTALPLLFDNSSLAATPGAYDPKGMTILYSVSGVKSHYDQVADYMSRNFQTALQRKRNGDRAITDATIATMTSFMWGLDPPTPVDDDNIGLRFFYNDSPLVNYKPTKQSTVYTNSPWKTITPRITNKP